LDLKVLKVVPLLSIALSKIYLLDVTTYSSFLVGIILADVYGCMPAEYRI
jgi:hypothetical protein